MDTIKRSFFVLLGVGWLSLVLVPQAIGGEPEPGKTYDKTNGLPDNTIHAIVEDNQGNLWISTNKGISHFNQKTQHFRNYYKNDGLQGNTFFQQSFLKTRNGEIYLGGFNGFNSFLIISLICWSCRTLFCSSFIYFYYWFSCTDCFPNFR